MAKQPDTSGDRRRNARERARLEAARQQKRRRLTQILIVAVVAVVALGIVGTAVIIGQRDRAGRVPQADTDVTVAGTSVPFSSVTSGIAVGEPDAPVKLDLWVDYSCPVCKQFETTNNDTLGTYIASKKLQVTYHNVQIVTAFGSRAGSAGACVATYEPDKWWAFNAAVYTNQPPESTDGADVDLKALAQQAGVSNADALSCIDKEPYKSWITDNTTAFSQAGATGTPTQFFNGTKEAGILSGQELTDKIDQLAKS